MIHRQFLLNNKLQKTIKGKMLIDQIIEYELRGPGPLVVDILLNWVLL